MVASSGALKGASQVAWLVSLLTYVSSVVLAMANKPSDVASTELVVTAMENLSFVAIATLALLILRTRPVNKVAWAMMLVGVTFPLVEFFGQLTEYAFEAWGQVGITLFAGWVSRWVWIGKALAVPLILLYYPDGNLPSARWRPIAPAIWSIVVITVFFEAVNPTPIAEFGDLPNPLGIDALTPDLALIGGISAIAYWGLFMLPVLGALSLIPRYRRSKGLERQQMKLIAWVGAVAVLYLVGLREINPVADAVSNTLFTLFVGTAFTAGIVRYRVFEIDRIISRTISYAIVVGLLAAAFFGVITLITTLLPAESSLAVAGSTLAVAGLFNPLRRRIQHGVDRRFNRSSYEAQAISEQFSERLQESRSVEGIAADWTKTVEETFQPEAIGVWLKENRSTPATEPSRST